MRATVLTDNIADGELQGEWGLSIYIEYQNRNILLDTGASDLFLKNAEKLGRKIEDVDYAVLSHAHYDHADGMDAFFCNNKKAKFYLREGSAENCYGKKWIFHRYIGLPKGILETYRERIVYAGGDYTLCPGVSLIPHKTPGLSRIGKRILCISVQRMDGNQMILHMSRVWYFRRRKVWLFSTAVLMAEQPISFVK